MTTPPMRAPKSLPKEGEKALLHMPGHQSFAEGWVTKITE
jgi:hypothetical protein